MRQLLSPLRLGPVEIPNRIVSTSHQTSLVEAHLPTEDLVAYHEARARGGVGLIVTEAIAVHHTGLLTAHTLGGYLPEIVPAYRRLADAVRPHGTRLVAQLLHSGREQIAAGARAPAIAPSSVPSQRFLTEPRPLTRREIAELVDGHRQAARHAYEGGLDGVEACAGFGYLPTQFLSPHANRRTDEYGGTFEQRLRFLREILEAMRAGVGPGGVVGLRLTDESASHDGNDVEAVLEAVRVLTAEGLADYVSAALGSSSTYVGSSFIVPPVPVERNAVRGFAAAVREASAVPVIGTGRVVDAADADRLIESGVCDAVGMTRALIADPAMPGKVARGERPIACIGCNQGCIGHYHAGIPIACTVNPWTGGERVLPRPVRAVSAQTVVVVGAGPAGCAAAATALASGHRVVVLERADGPGGQMRLALANPGHRETAVALIGNLERWIEGADIRFGADADVGTILAEAPDRVVLATGAGPYAPALEGAGLPVLGAWDVLGGAPAGERVVVADWGGDWTGWDVAECLHARGASVRLVTSAVTFGPMMHQYQRNLALARLDEAGIELLHHLRPVAVRPGRAVFRHVFSGREVELSGADALVVAAGRQAETGLYEALVEAGAAVERVGDVLGPRSFEEAIREGTLAMLGAPGAAERALA